MYEGGFDNFSINGHFNMEREILFKNNPGIEATKRLNMAYLLYQNPKMIEVLQQTGAVFFHGTNANALPSIIKYGINSVNKSIENNIEVTTGESFSRIKGKRSFISVTDCLNVALSYAGISPDKEKSQKQKDPIQDSEQNSENAMIKYKESFWKKLLIKIKKLFT